MDRGSRHKKGTILSACMEGRGMLLPHKGSVRKSPVCQGFVDSKGRNPGGGRGTKRGGEGSVEVL